MEKESQQPKSFICANCLESFEPAWTDEEASLEFAQKFPGQDIRDAVVICEDCYVAIMGAL